MGSIVTQHLIQQTENKLIQQGRGTHKERVQSLKFDIEYDKLHNKIVAYCSKLENEVRELCSWYGPKTDANSDLQVYPVERMESRLHDLSRELRDIRDEARRLRWHYKDNPYLPDKLKQLMDAIEALKEYDENVRSDMKPKLMDFANMNRVNKAVPEAGLVLDTCYRLVSDQVGKTYDALCKFLTTETKTDLPHFLAQENVYLNPAVDLSVAFGLILFIHSMRKFTKENRSSKSPSVKEKLVSWFKKCMDEGAARRIAEGID